MSKDAIPGSASLAAAADGHTDALRALLAHDVSCSVHRSKLQQTPLMLSAAVG